MKPSLLVSSRQYYSSSAFTLLMRRQSCRSSFSSTSFTRQQRIFFLKNPRSTISSNKNTRTATRKVTNSPSSSLELPAGMHLHQQKIFHHPRCRQQHRYNSYQHHHPATSTTKSPAPGAGVGVGGFGAANSTASASSASSFYSLLMTRAAFAVGIVYCITEYHFDITLCEGPSMMPTIKPYGEIVLIDKRSIRKYGIQGGTCVGEERAKIARQKQKEYEKEQEQQLKKSNKKKNTIDHEWYEPYISVTDKKPSTWRQAFQQIRSPLSVGDVVVLNHPHRKGTVCKRVLGLPGDQVLYNGLLIVPDGHLWVEGDNPANSSDSRQSYGPVPINLVIGRVVARIWPLRGHAFMERGGRPRQQGEDDAVTMFRRVHLSTFSRRTNSCIGSTVLPAGYDGQQIVKYHRDTSQEKKEEEN